ncbi:MAG: DUF4494 family protein [Bacteroidales bacterium]
MNDINFYKVSSSFKVVDENGATVGKKATLLIQGVSLGDAEKSAKELLKDFTEFEDTIVVSKAEISKVNDFLFNDNFTVDSGKLINNLIELTFEDTETTCLYGVNVEYYDPEATRKRSKDTIYVPEEDPTKAIAFVKKFLTNIGETRDFKFLGVQQTDFSSILLTDTTYKSIVGRYDSLKG